MQAYRLEQRLASFHTTAEQDAYLLSKAGPSALGAVPRQIVTFRMLRKRALQVRVRAWPVESDRLLACTSAQLETPWGPPVLACAMRCRGQADCL